MKSFFCALFVVLLAHASSAFATSLDDFKNQSGVINIAGGTAHIPVMMGAAKNIMQYNDKINITVAGGGSGAGVKQVGEGLVQIGNTGRALKDGEIKQCGLISYPFAIDGVAVALHKSNKVSDLSPEQVRNVFNGKITNWKELGGEDIPITLYTREDGSGTREVFVEILLEKGEISQHAVIVNSNGAMKTAIAHDQGGIGYIGIGYVDASVKGASINGIQPTQENAANGTYKVTRFLYMNTKGAPDTLTASFIKYITASSDGKELIEKAGYIPITK